MQATQNFITCLLLSGCFLCKSSILFAQPPSQPLLSSSKLWEKKATTPSKQKAKKSSRQSSQLSCSSTKLKKSRIKKVATAPTPQPPSIQQTTTHSSSQQPNPTQRTHTRKRTGTSLPHDLWARASTTQTTLAKTKPPKRKIHRTQQSPTQATQRKASRKFIPNRTKPKKISPQRSSRFRLIPGKGLRIQSDDRLFRLFVQIRAQLRYTGSFSEENNSHSLILRRARLNLGGHLWGKRNRFKIALAFSPRDLGVKNGNPTRTPFLDWYLQFDYHRDIKLRIGQYKVPYNRQYMYSSSRLWLADRAISHSEFHIDRDIGISLRSDDFLGLQRLRYRIGFFLGEGHSRLAIPDLGFLYVARLLYLPFGLFNEKNSTNFARKSNLRVSLGLSYAFLAQGKKNKGLFGSPPQDGGTTDTHNAQFDLLVKIAGFTLFAEGFLRTGTRNLPHTSSITPEKPRTGLGGMLQMSWLFPTHPIEATIRYGFVRPIGLETSLAPRNEFGGGLSFYIVQHALKVQLDTLRYWSKNINEAEQQVRLQLEIAM